MLYAIMETEDIIKKEISINKGRFAKCFVTCTEQNSCMKTMAGIPKHILHKQNAFMPTQEMYWGCFQ